MKMKHHAPRPPSLMRKGCAHTQAEPQQLFITYECPYCNHRWHDIWECAVDSDCPHCETRDIQALTWERL